VLLIGVEDNGHVCGSQLTQRELDRLALDIGACMEPRPVLRTGFADFPEGRVAVIETASPLSPPYLVRGRNGAERCPVRAGDRNQEASPLARRSLGRRKPRIGTGVPKLLRRILKEHGRITVESYAGACNISMRRARRELVKLVQDGRLSQYSEGPHTYFC
jgi:predicted HTH transcriptional regulator